jgi:hypothetical protein
MQSKNTSEKRRADFVFGAGVSLTIEGSRPVFDHFVAEYYAASHPRERRTSDVHIELESPLYRELKMMGGYKTARWRVSLGDTGWEPISAKIALLSTPRSFGLSLIQGYFVEPLLEMALTRRKAILAPAAGFISGQDATLLVGASRSGKSSLMVRALGGGVRILGDDQLILTSEERVLAFPRRLRVYPDIRTTATSAYSTFPPSLRSALRGLNILSSATAGWVRPPLRIPPSALGLKPAKEDHALHRLYLIERDDRAARPGRSVVEPDALVGQIMTLLDRQRERLTLLLVAKAGWMDFLKRTRELERAILGKALDGINARKLVVPSHWPAPQAIDYLEQEIGLGINRRL